MIYEKYVLPFGNTYFLDIIDDQFVTFHEWYDLIDRKKLFSVDLIEEGFDGGLELFVCAFYYKFFCVFYVDVRV